MIVLKEISAHVAYCAQYNVFSMKELISTDGEKNEFFELQALMEKENPYVTVPDIGEDYNYIEYPFKQNQDGTYKIVYYDKVDKAGIDNQDGIYKFIQKPTEIVVSLDHVGSFDTIHETFYKIYQWIKEKGFVVTGTGRCCAIHGPWDRAHECDYVNECQVPICK